MYSQVPNKRAGLIKRGFGKFSEIQQARGGGGGLNRGLFVSFDPSDVNVSKFAYVPAKL